MKYTICGNYGAGNIGDELILSGLINYLKERDLRTDITVLTANPSETRTLHNVKSVPHFPAGIRSLFKYKKNSATVKAVKASDYFILGGGGLFDNLTFRASVIWSLQAYFARKQDKKVLCWGQSISYIKNPIARFFAKKTFRSAHEITVRDRESATALKKMGIKKKIAVVPDFAFSSSLAIKKSPKKTLKTEQILVCLRELPNMSKHVILEIATFLNKQPQKTKIILLDFQQTGKYRDSIIHKKLLKHLKHPNVTHIPDVKINDLAQIYQQSSLVLGMRLHSIIAAIITKRPFIAFSYAPKVTAFLHTVDREETILEIEEINSQNISHLAKRLKTQ